MDKEETANRKEWIDIAKGIGIILVVLGHCFVKDTIVHNWIFSFHMPLFFILSGYCFKPAKYKSWKTVAKKRFKALIVPYFCFVAFGMIVSLIIPAWRRLFTLKGVLKDLYQGYPSLTHITSIWYLISLYIITVVFYVTYYISNKFNKKIILYMFIVANGFLGYLITIVKKLLDNGGNSSGGKGGFKMPGDRLPLTIDASMTALVFFALGVLAFANIERLKNKWNIYISLICMVINILFGSILNTRVNIHGCTYGNVIYFYIAALLGSLSIILFSMWLEDSDTKIMQVIKKILVFYGRNSLFMFAIQSLFINLFFLGINSITGKHYVIFEKLPNIYAVVAFLLIIVLLPFTYVIYHKVKQTIKHIGKNEKVQ